MRRSLRRSRVRQGRASRPVSRGTPPWPRRCRCSRPDRQTLARESVGRAEGAPSVARYLRTFLKRSDRTADGDSETFDELTAVLPVLAGPEGPRSSTYVVEVRYCDWL